MYGQRGKELVQELRHADAVTSYNEEAVRSIVSETTALAKEVAVVAEASRDDEAFVAPLVVFSEAIARNRRCLLAYQCVSLLAGALMDAHGSRRPCHRSVVALHPSPVPAATSGAT